MPKFQFPIKKQQESMFQVDMNMSARWMLKFGCRLVKTEIL